jgi:uncharacterized protein YcaQ
MKIHWSKAQAKAYLLTYHNINTNQSMSIQSLFNRFHSIQYDPIHVVGYNHDLVCHARIHDYKLGDLDDHIYHHKNYIDHWDRIASIIDIKDYENLSFIRQEKAKRLYDGVLKTYQIDLDTYSKNILYLFDQGPLNTKEIDLGVHKNASWKKNSPSLYVLEYLMYQSKLAIYQRVRNQRSFDQFRRVYPKLSKRNAFKDLDSFLLYYLKRRIDVVGMTWNLTHNQLGNPFLMSKKIRQYYFDQLVIKELVTEVIVEDLPYTFYIPKDVNLDGITLEENVTFLSPLDNMIWDRKLIQVLFDFNYTWEIYVPKEKRRYGYYVLPMILKDQFIGRIEFDVKDEVVAIKNIWLENNILQDDVMPFIDQAIQKLNQYLLQK